MDQHPARLDTAPDATSPTCSVCGRPVIGGGDQLRHVGEARRRRLAPARGDVASVRRAEVLAERALRELVWTPHTSDADRAAAIVERLYEAGLISSRPRAVRPRAVRPEPVAAGALTS